MSLHQGERVAPERPSGPPAPTSVFGHSLLTTMMIIAVMPVFVPAALLHCAVRNGRRAAWAALLLALGLASLWFALIPQGSADAASMAWSYLAALALAIALPTMAALPLVERGEQFGRVVVFALIGSVAGLALTELGARVLFDWSPYALQVEQAKQTATQFVALYRAKGMPHDVVALLQRWLGFTTFVLPATMLINISVVFILSLLMLGRLQAWRERAASRGDVGALGAYRFRNFALPEWLLFGFVLGGLTPVTTGLVQKLAANVLALVAFLYIVQGLAIFRFLLAAMNAGFAGNALGWLLLTVLMFTGVGPLLLGVAGLFDPFFDFRHFKKRKDDSHESHSD